MNAAAFCDDPLDGRVHGRLGLHIQLDGTKVDPFASRQIGQLGRVLRIAIGDAAHGGINGVAGAMVQGEIPEHRLTAVYDPMINLILNGSKTMTVGDRTFHYDPATYFLMSVDLPAAGSVHSSTTGEPYLAISLTLDPPTVANLIADLPKPAGSDLYGSGFSVAPGRLAAHAAADGASGRDHGPCARL